LGEEAKSASNMGVFDKERMAVGEILESVGGPVLR